MLRTVLEYLVTVHHCFLNTLSSLLLFFHTPFSEVPLRFLLPGGLYLGDDGQICQSRGTTPSDWYARDNQGCQTKHILPNPFLIYI